MYVLDALSNKFFEKVICCESAKQSWKVVQAQVSNEKNTKIFEKHFGWMSIREDTKRLDVMQKGKS